MNELIYNSWNHRVMRVKVEPLPTHPAESHYWYGIFEVYYEDGVPQWSTVDPCEPFGETLEELKEDYERMAVAFTKSVLCFETREEISE